MLTVMVVDDNPTLRELITMQLPASGYNVVEAYLRKTPYHLDEAEDGRRATELAFKHDYDVILMDIQMPVMDGYTAVRKIRAWEEDNKRARTPIIALTASALDEAVRQIKQAGFDLHVSKPVKRATLLNAIAQIAKTSTSGGETADDTSVGALADPHRGVDSFFAKS